MGFLTGKKILIAGIASNRSIAYGIAKAMKREGAELAFSYPNDKMKARVEKFAAELDSDIVLPCDVAQDEEIVNLFAELNRVIFWKIWIVKLLLSRTKSALTVFRPWPKQLGL